MLQNKQILYALILLIVCATFVPPYVLYLAICTFLFFQWKFISKVWSIDMSAYLAIVCIGFLTGLINQNGFRNIAADILYFTFSLLVILTSKILTFKKLLDSRLLLSAMVITILLFYGMAAFDVYNGAALNLALQKKYAESGEIAAIGMVVLTSITAQSIFKRYTFWFLFVTVVLSGSRSALMLALLTISSCFISKINKFYFVVGIALSLALLMMGRLWADLIPYAYLRDLVYEVSISLKFDYATWRGTEAGLAINDLLNSSLNALAIGKGFGSSISANSYFPNKFERIPFFHNGYITILFKAGIIGLILFSVYIFNIFKCRFLRQYQISALGGLALYTFLIMGLVSGDVLVYLPIMLGMLSCQNDS